MTNRKMLRIAGKTAFIAALMGGSSAVVAQDVVAPTAVPAAPIVAAPPAAPTITPPAAVRTLPTANDTINPAAAQAAEAEAAEKRETQVTPRVKPQPTVRAVAPVAVAAATPTPSADPANEPVAVPAADAIAPAAAGVGDSPVASARPVSISDQVADDSGDDVALIGGIAAALAALGIGAAAVSRRRRNTSRKQASVTAREQNFTAPRPIREDPAFAPFAAQPAKATMPLSVGHGRTEAPAERTTSRAPVMTRPDIPVTDPLFSKPVPSVPITDPMFAPRNDVEIPITDPLFAKHDRFAGPVQASPARRETELVN